MKNLLLVITFFYSSLLYSQNIKEGAHEGLNFRDYHCIQQKTYTEIKKNLPLMIDSLEESGVIPMLNFKKSYPEDHVLLDWPVAQNLNYDDNGFYGISNFVDHEAAYPDQIQDYNCGTRSYDLPSGYNHAGIDIFASPFPWQKMDNDQVVVLAAAAGYIIYKEETKEDKNCDFNNDGQWNALYIRHDDGSTAWYGHMKKNSLTPLVVGDRIEAREFIGVVGSSGYSTGPHLHFELYDSENQLTDPFAGACNPSTNSSWWKEQKAYKDPALLKIMTHSSPPAPYGCYDAEQYRGEINFKTGQTAYLVSYYRDQTIADIIYHRLIAPDGSVYQEWDNEFEEDYVSSYWYWTMNTTTETPKGKWAYQIVYENQPAQTHYFYVIANDEAPELETEKQIIIDNETESFVVSLRNEGNAGLTVEKIDFTEALHGKWFGDIAPGEEKQILVQIKPELLTGAEQIIIDVKDKEPFTIDVLNQDQAHASIAVDQSFLSFGELLINTVDSLAIVISNNGLAPLSISEWEFPEGFNGPSEEFVVQTMDTTQVFIYFTPQEKLKYEGEINIYSNAINEPVLSMSVSGEGSEVILNNLKDKLFGFKLYPNPVDDLLKIEYAVNRPSELVVTDINGQTVLKSKDFTEQSDNLIKLKMDKLPAGAYILKIRTLDKKLVNIKFIKK